MQYGMRGEQMDMIFEWIRNLVCYLVLMTMIIHLLPDKKYERYLRLFAGMVFLMMLLEPMGNVTGLQEQAVEAFSRVTFQNDAKLLKMEIEDADGKRMARLVERYREVIETEIRLIAEREGIECTNVEVLLEDDMEGGTFGRVRFLDMTLGAEHGPADLEELKQRIGEYYGLEERDMEIHLEAE